jgi:hypothetical protein
MPCPGRILAGPWNTRLTLHSVALVGMAVFALTIASAVPAATITVNSLADPGASDICILRDAISAANSDAAGNGCAAGNGADTIVFASVVSEN